ncbi:type II toxin-antitoxin system RelE/ParE family toxin [Alkalibacterium iburiense]|uniref:Type II toxin-antitoxin system RelE/ParE family toxin n=1 Tax=Alkalibacterium iburiense TaxID=290589 RepID=A0ABP3GZI2_9LACT
MSKYRVILTQNVLNDLEDISSYIENILHSPLAALNLKIKLTKAALSLDEKPYRGSKYSNSLKYIKNKEIRKLVIENYLIFYYVDEYEKEVNVVTIHHRLKGKVEKL